MTKEDSQSRGPKVTVVIPMLNEGSYISKCIESILEQDYPSELLEILVVDGGSTDNSLDIVKDFEKKHGNVVLLGGRGVNCPAGMNVGIRKATGSIVAKIDAHGFIAKDYLSKSVKWLSQNREIKCVGGLITPIPETHTAKANALARSSRFGVGQGIYSSSPENQYTDTVQCGVYQKEALEEVGLFDEALQFGEDEELNWRIRKKGYKIFVTPEIRFFYFPRDTFRKLFRQYLNYGRLRIQVVKKHKDFLRLKHLIPGAFVLTLFLTAALALFGAPFTLPLFAAIVLYAGTALLVSISIGLKEGFSIMWRLPVSFAALHFGYGLGILKGIAGAGNRWFGERRE